MSSSDTAIRVEGLAKQYRIGRHRDSFPTLRDSLASALKQPFRRFQAAVRGEPASAGPETIWALQDVSFEIKQGEIVGLVGRNGAGKSTLLKILARVTDPTRGLAEVRGRVGSMLEVGTGFHPELTGRENLYLNGSILGMKRAEIKRKFDEIVEFAGIERFIDTPVKYYSSGMYVRLAFAVAAHLDPDIMMVDEVLSVGDADFQRKCLSKMKEAYKDGRTVLFISHNMGLIQSLCKRVIMLRHGSVFADGTTETAVGTYLQSLETVASQDLPERTDRAGTGVARLEKIEVTTGNMMPASRLATGRPARFIFSVTTVFPSMSCRFTIYDQNGLPVMFFDSALHSDLDTTDCSSPGGFVCELDELLLNPGRYRLDASLMRNRELLDELEAAACFNVEQGTLRGRAVLYSGGYGSVSLPHRWITPVC